MTTLREAAQQALEALVDAQNHNYALKHKEADQLINALRAALAEPVQEPVAWMWEETAPRSSTGIGGIDRKLIFCRPADEPWKRNITPLYTAPPQRTPLTDEEIYAAIKGIDSLKAVEVARAIERAHGITGPGDRSR